VNESVDQAAQYLSPPSHAFWQWSEDGSAVLWRDGRTIAFRQEAEAVIERLAPGGLPPFGAIVLLLAACRDGWESSDGRRTLDGLIRGFEQMQTNVAASPGLTGSRIARCIAARRIRDVLERLDDVGRLPEQVRHGKLAKAVLAEAVFDPGTKQLDRSGSAHVTAALADGVPPEALAPRVHEEDAFTRFASHAEALQPGLERVDAESLLLRARTGFDEAPKPADIQPPNADQLRRLLTDLRDDPEFAGLAKVAQNLMAATHIPRALHAREELPVGGVSDLSNRGSLDRLLVSELANDPLTLAVRVALSEALYLRRESPPRDPPRQRAILLDCGIRLWGVPRAFAIAAALAFAATADRKAAIATYRANASGVEPINFGTRAGLVDCMAALEPSPHPGAALRPFVEAIAGDARSMPEVRTPPHAGAERGEDRPIGVSRPGAAPDLSAPSHSAGKTAAPDPGRRGETRDQVRALTGAALPRRGGQSGRGATQGVTEAILITHPGVLADAEFGAALRSLPIDLLFIATVDRDGRFQLFSHTGTGRRLVSDAKLDLAALFTQRRPATPLVETPNRTTLPAIFAADPFPLRLPCAIRPAQAMAAESLGLIGISNDGRLLQWTSREKQARQLTAALPPGRALGLFREYAKLPVIRAVIGQHRQGIVHVVRAWVEEGRTSITQSQVDIPKPVGCCMAGSTLCVISADAVRALSPASNQPIATLDLADGLTWRHDRFFKRRADWFALAFDGRSLRLEKVPIESSYLARLLFDRQGVDGPWAVYPDGSVEAAGGQRIQCATPFKGPLQHVRASRDGHRLVAVTGAGVYRLDLRSNKGWTSTSCPVNWTGSLIMPLNWSHDLPGMAPKRFTSIFVNRKGELSLISQRSQTWTFTRQTNGSVSLSKSDGVPLAGAGQGFKAFKQIRPPEGMQIKLWAAEWPDGSQAFLDSRWLLHLKSADPKVPELSIVLTTWALAGWASDGRVFGNRVFLPDGDAAPIQEMAEILRQFVVRLR
jgi:hypothetical protein